MNDVQLCNLISLIVSISGSLLGIVVGGFVTWRVSRKYYKIASDELRKESDELRKEIANLQRLNTITINVLEENGLAKINHNDKGEIIGSERKLAGKSQSVSNVFGDLSVEHPTKS